MNSFTPCYLLYLDDQDRQRFWPTAELVVHAIPWWIARVVAAKIAERGAVVTVVERL